MKRILPSTDATDGSLLPCILKIGIPLLFTNLLDIVITFPSQDIRSNYAGDNYFLIVGLLSGITSSVPLIYTAVSSAAWIKTASKACTADGDEKKRSLFDGLYAILLISILLFLTSAVFSDIILKLMSVPTDIYSQTKTFYLLTSALYIFSGIASYCINIINGICNFRTIFTVNLLNICLPLLVSFILLVLFHAQIIGAAIVSGVSMLIMAAISLIFLRKNGYKGFKPSHFIPRYKNIIRIILFGLSLALQSIFCLIGSLVLSFQANKYLNADYLSVLSVSIPLSGIMSIFGQIICALVPVNYALKKFDRVKKIFSICLVSCVIYATLCFIVYATSGRAYFSTLFDSKETIEYGVSYWTLFGLGFIPVSVIFVVRTFFESIGKSFVALFSGVFEMLGMLFCAFILIPNTGHIGRSLGNTIGWLLAAIYLSVSYLILKKSIYTCSDIYK